MACTIFNFTDGYISIAEPHCEVNLTVIVSVEHRTEAVRKDNILQVSNIHGKRTGSTTDPCGTPKRSLLSTETADLIFSVR